MSTSRDRIPEQALDCHRPGELEPGPGGPLLLGLGKEALLTRLTTLRSRDHHAAIDFIFETAKRRNAFVFTTTSVFAEVVGTVRSGTGANTVERLWNDLTESHISVLYDGESWDVDSDLRAPKSRFGNVQQLYHEQRDLDFKSHNHCSPRCRSREGRRRVRRTPPGGFPRGHTPAALRSR